MIFKKKRPVLVEEEGGPHFIYYYEFSIYTQKKIPYILYILEDMLFYIYIYYLLFPDHMALPTLELIWQFERETNKKSKTFFFMVKKRKNCNYPIRHFGFVLMTFCTTTITQTTESSQVCKNETEKTSEKSQFLVRCPSKARSFSISSCTFAKSQNQANIIVPTLNYDNK